MLILRSLLIMALLSLGVTAQDDTPACSHDSECAACATDDADGEAVCFSAADSAVVDGPVSPEIEQIAEYIQGLMQETDGKTLRLDKSKMEEALGFSATQEMLSQALGVALPGSNFGGKMTNRCSDYGACSLYGDLSFATGDVLSMYEREKGMDGSKLENLWLPAFKARNLAGEVVTSADLLGRPTLIVPMAAHCYHSFDTMPMLNDLVERFGPEGFSVVAIMVNSTSVEDVKQSLSGIEHDFDVWVYEGDMLGDVLGTHLVPSHLLVDARGKVMERFVGFKQAEFIAAHVQTLLHPETTESSGI